jgi:hypothetical protein
MHLRGRLATYDFGVGRVADQHHPAVLVNPTLERIHLRPRYGRGCLGKAHESLDPAVKVTTF